MVGPNNQSYLIFTIFEMSLYCKLKITVMDMFGHTQWCIAKNGGGYTQKGVATGLKVPCLFMITEESIRCQKNRRLVYAVYPRIPPPPIHHWAHRRRWLAGWPCDCLSLAHIDTGAPKMADLKLVDLTKMGEMKLAKLKMADQK